MPASKVYDNAQWHVEGNFPKDLPPSQAAVHTGMYLAWLIEKGLLSEPFVNELGERLVQLKAKQLSGPRLLESMGGALTSEMLTDEGNRFTAAYFDLETGDFLGDYEDSFCELLPSIYHVEDSWENYDFLTASLEVRYEAWRAAQSD